MFAVTGGAQTMNKKVYMIDAQTGDILTSFEANPVSEWNVAEEEEELLFCVFV